MRNVTYYAFDYDGCVGDECDLRYYLIQQLNNQKSDARYVISFSNRQSKAVDDNNNSTGSNSETSFAVFDTLVNKQMDATYNPSLMADLYANKPSGYSHAQCVSSTFDASSAYTPDYVFDDLKSSLLYYQVHQACKDAQSCDFLYLSHEVSTCLLGGKNRKYKEVKQALLKLQFKSNAAYVADAQTGSLYYVNKMNKTVIVLTQAACRYLLNTMQNKNSNLYTEDNEDTYYLFADGKVDSDNSTFTCTYNDDLHDFEIPIKGYRGRVGGVTLSDMQLSEFNKVLMHEHKHNACKIVFNVFDDRSDILDSLFKVFTRNDTDEGTEDGECHFFPSNIKVRLWHYDPANSKVLIPKYTIFGTGLIDVDPAATIKGLLPDETLDDFNFNDSFHNLDAVDRKLVSPTVQDDVKPSPNTSSLGSASSDKNVFRVGLFSGAVGATGYASQTLLASHVVTAGILLKVATVAAVISTPGLAVCAMCALYLLGKYYCRLQEESSSPSHNYHQASV